jgi:hypothetical protein
MARAVLGAISLWVGTADGAPLAARHLAWRDEGYVEGVSRAVGVASLSCLSGSLMAGRTGRRSARPSNPVLGTARSTGLFSSQPWTVRRDGVWHVQGDGATSELGSESSCRQRSSSSSSALLWWWWSRLIAGTPQSRFTSAMAASVLVARPDTRSG